MLGDAANPLLLDSSIKCVGRWGELSSNEDALSVEDDQMCAEPEDQAKALVMVDNAVEILAQPTDCVGLLPEEHEADRLIEGKMIEIAQILGIFMEGKLGEMSRFIREMLTRRRGVVNTKRFLRGGKKTKTLRELEKSATSINYDRQVGDGKMGVQLVGI
eukprot:TRINITY_DN20872_c1_g1_i1.p2 TRINITY_DN20872_c1_g1~~TRINITY_DN20872_c1_g1_i1.p2  ORF type:complete len:160 (-),score=40.87 TRINITY_DN20872_c1_g1_i1:730-1209(-)